MSVDKRATHQTALRVVALWQWLCKEPLTLDDMQQRFMASHQQNISVHSLKLYLSTLRNFGCQLTRQRQATGQNAYVITGHDYLKPMLGNITAEHWEKLAEGGGIAQTFAEQHQWLKWLNQLAVWGGLPWKAHLLNEDHLSDIELAIHAHSLLEVHYRTLTDSAARVMTCLPLGGYIRRHRHYLRVLRQGRESPVLLRANRIEQVIPLTDNAPALAQLRSFRRYQPLVEVHFYVPSGFELPLLPDFRRMEPLADGSGLAVFLETRDTFLLLQQLLGCGLPFAIIQPSQLQQDVGALFGQLAAWHQRTGG